METVNDMLGVPTKVGDSVFVIVADDRYHGKVERLVTPDVAIIKRLDNNEKVSLFYSNFININAIKKAYPELFI
jgi:hypothetical protein